MAQTALPAPRTARPRGGCSFGLFDADGWPWAIVKRCSGSSLMIMLLGYLPDRAYYFTVQQTVDLGLLAWSPINFCPPENETLPCPAPAGATLPWHRRPQEVHLPAARDGRRGRRARHDVPLRRRHRRHGGRRRTCTSPRPSAPATSTSGRPARRSPRRAPTPRPPSSAARCSSSAATAPTASRRPPSTA